MKRDSFLAWMGAAAGLRGGAARSDAHDVLPADIRDLINVKSYGALGDGKHDDTKAIQRAVDAAQSGTPVLFPVGRYRVRQPIVLHDDTVLLGYGRFSVLWCTEPGCDVVVCRKVKRLFLEGIALDGDRSNRDGIVTDNADDVRLRRCWIKGMGGRGVVVNNTPCAIVDSTVEMCGQDGILVMETNSGQPAHVVACYVFANGGNGIRFTRNGNQGMITACEIVNNGGSGVRIDTSSHMISIVGNAIMGSGVDGVEISDNSCYTGVASNALSGNKRAGVSIKAGANGTALSANRFVDNCVGASVGIADLMVSTSLQTTAFGNVFARTTPAKPVGPGIVTDDGAAMTSVGNVFHGLVAPPSAGH